MNVSEDKLNQEEVLDQEVSEETNPEEQALNTAEAEGIAGDEVALEEEAASDQDTRDEEILQLKDRLARQMAEFDNFRKRSFKEKEQMYEKGAKEVLEKLLPVIDNFERAFSAATTDHQNDPFVKGIDMIYKQFLTLLDDVGVEEIEAKDQPFDPNLHHAVQHEESEDHGESLVTDVYQKGYMYKDTVLRYSMVKVVNQKNLYKEAI